VRLLTEAGTPFACFGRTGPGAAAELGRHRQPRRRRPRPWSTCWPGFERIAFAGYRTPNSWDTERAAGFRDALAAAGISADQADMLLVDDGNAHKKIRSLLSAGRPGLRPDAIVSGSDRLAGAIYSVAAELRLRIGRDLAVTGFDGSAAAALMHPRLTTVAIPGRRHRRAGGRPGAAPGRPRTRSAARRSGAGQAAAGREHRRVRPGA
jgi:hypothetical protein